MNSFDLCWTNKIQCQTGHMTYFWPMTNFLCIYLWSRIHIYIIQALNNLVGGRIIEIYNIIFQFANLETLEKTIWIPNLT